jgi:hypothetical protein
MSSRCLFIRAEREQRSLTWSTLVRDYANSYGAHQSPSVYRYLFEARVYVTVGLPVVSFMLRRLGVAVSAACHELLAELQVDHEPPHHAAAVNGTDLGLATVRRNGDTDELLCLVRHDRDDISDVDVMSVPVSGDKEMVYRFPESGPPPVLIVRSPKSSP